MARLVGRLNKLIDSREEMPTILMGPGRWGTTTPAMGVPVTFSEINNITAIAEIAYQYGSLIPDLSGPISSRISWKWIFSTWRSTRNGRRCSSTRRNNWDGSV